MHFTDQWVILGVKWSKPCWLSIFFFFFNICFTYLFYFVIFCCCSNVTFIDLFPDPVGSHEWWKGLESQTRQKSSTCFLTWRLLLHIPFSRGLCQSLSALFSNNTWNQEQSVRCCPFASSITLNYKIRISFLQQIKIESLGWRDWEMQAQHLTDLTVRHKET